MDTKVYELLRVAIGNREYLTRPLSAAEWETVYYICELQAVLGIAFVGIQKLPKEQMPPSELFAKWQKDAQKEKEIRERVTEICRKACEKHEKNGFDSCVLMPSPILVRGERLESRDESLEFRGERLEVRGGDPKDIDILCWSREKKDGKRTIVEYVNFQYVASTKHIKPKVIRHHVNFESGNIPVEVRFKSEYLNNPWYNGRFENWVKELIDSNSMLKQGGDSHAPSDSFNVVYQLLHLYKKLFCEGIRLGHLLEYYYTLREFSVEMLEVRAKSGEVRAKRLEDRIPPQSPCVGGKVSVEGLEVCGERIGSLSTGEGGGRGRVMNIIERLGMKKFAGSVMYVLQTVFGMPDEYLICKPNNRNGSFVLKMTMLAGDYTRYLERTRTLRHLGRLGHHLYWLKRNRPFLTQYPAEVLFELYRRIKG